MSIIKNYFKQNSVTHTFSSCQWPIGDPQEKEFHFCEAQTVQGKPYCQSHCDVAYIDEKELKKTVASLHNYIKSFQKTIFILLTLLSNFLK